MARPGHNARNQVQVLGKIRGPGKSPEGTAIRKQLKNIFMKTRNFIMLSAVLACVFAACEKENGNDRGNGGDNEQNETVQTVSGTWEAGTTV